MIKSKLSTGPRDGDIGAIGVAIMRWQDLTQAFDEAVGRLEGLNGAELRCLSLLTMGARSAGEIAAAVGLTPAAITALIDRLEKRGLVERTRSRTDRRKVLVAATPDASAIASQYYGPIGKDGALVLCDFSDAELATIRRFLEATIALQERHLVNLTAATSSEREG